MTGVMIIKFWRMCAYWSDPRVPINQQRFDVMVNRDQGNSTLQQLDPFLIPGMHTVLTKCLKDYYVNFPRSNLSLAYIHHICHQNPFPDFQI